MKTLAPIALFTYNRPVHVRRTIEALQKNSLAKETDLFIFSDGWKNELDKPIVEDIRRYLHSVDGFKNIHIVESDTNKKLAPSLIAGISKIFETFDRIIVFEDDIVCSEFTLEFLNDALEIYKDDLKVGMIHGHIETLPGLPDLFFDSRGGCLAWGTWRTAWNEVCFDGESLLLEIVKQKREKEFDINGAYKYMKMLRAQIAGRNSSWAVRVYASFFLKNILTLYPGRSYAQHIGFDSGTHCNGLTNGTAADGNITAIKNVATRIPVVINEEARKKIEKFYREQKRLTIPFIKNEIQKRLNKLKCKIILF